MTVTSNNPRGKHFYFIFEALGSLACGFYSTYVFFWLRDHYGFGNAENLGVAAVRGLIVALASWQGGRFAQRRGYYRALHIGVAGMIVALLAGVSSPGLAIQLLTVAAWTAATSFVWPALMALVSEGEKEAGLTRLLGIYNVIWASCSALSYFFGGWLYDHLGATSIFWLPTGVFAVMLGLAIWLAYRYPVSPQQTRKIEPAVHAPEASAFLQPVSPRTFLHMAWLANPFACIGLSTVLAMVPGLARELHLSTTSAGFFCSIWFFARLAAFIVLWRWKGWHYRFRWLLAASAGLVAGFAALLMGRELLFLAFAQVIFGLSVGLMYYSSLFYSMDVGETKGEHGGLHEAAMGAGNCVGPAIAAAALVVAPQVVNAGAYAVSALLAVGFLGLIRLRLKPILLVLCLMLASFASSAGVVTNTVPTLWDTRDVPHGQVHMLWYKSKALGMTRRIHVYTPPGYDAKSRKRYPVLYYLHGGGDNDSWGIATCRVNFILDNLLAEKRARPMIVVMPYGFNGASADLSSATSPVAKSERFTAFGDDLLNEMAPLVELNYRIEAGAEHRAVAGISMGGGQSLYFALEHPESFRWVALFSPGFLGKVDCDTDFPEAAARAAKGDYHFDFFWMGCGTHDKLLNYDRKMDRWLTHCQIAHEYHEYEGIHDTPSWRSDFATVAPLLFVK